MSEANIPIETKQAQKKRFQFPFLTKTRTLEDKENLRNEYRRQQEMQRKNQSPYKLLQKIYERFSASAILENKAATARDHLANERTFLAWLRTSLSLITVGVAITQLYQLTPVTEAMPRAKSGKYIGATFVIFSILFLYLANARYFHTQISLTKGQFPASRGAILIGSTCIFSLLIAMFIIIITSI